MLQPVIMNVSAKGAVVIPAEIRRFLGIKAKGKVLVIPKDKEAKAEIIALPKNPQDFLRGCLKGEKDMLKELLEERRKDLEYEQRGL